MSFETIQLRVLRGAAAAVAAGMLTVGVVSVSAQAAPKGQGTGRHQPQAGAPQAPRQEAAPAFIEVTLAKGKKAQLSIDAIKKASNGTIKRGSLDFAFTPLTPLLKSLGVSPTARIRVSGGAGSTPLLLTRSSKALNPDDFGFIFNQRGLPVLTPKPGTPAASAPVQDDRPQIRGVVAIEVLSQ